MKIRIELRAVLVSIVIQHLIVLIFNFNIRSKRLEFQDPPPPHTHTTSRNLPFEVETSYDGVFCVSIIRSHSSGSLIFLVVMLILLSLSVLLNRLRVFVMYINAVLRVTLLTHYGTLKIGYDELNNQNKKRVFVTLTTNLKFSFFTGITISKCALSLILLMPSQCC